MRGRWTNQRAGRTLAAALCCAALALGAHLCGGGSAPGPTALLLALLAPAVLGAWASSGPWSTGRLVAVLAAGQALAHLALSATTDSAMPASCEHADLRMALWHLVGTGVTAVLLTRAERVLCGLVAEVAPALAAVLRPWPGPTTYLPRMRADFPLRTPLHGILLGGTVAGRGPPLQSAS